MPSLHVAIALWVALVVRAYIPRAAFLGFAYFALILIGSVLLGWHYSVDGIVSVIIVLVAWRTAAVVTSTSQSRDLPLIQEPSLGLRRSG